MARHHNKAILANIADANLDPKKRHTKLDKLGKFVVSGIDKKALLENDSIVLTDRVVDTLESDIKQSIVSSDVEELVAQPLDNETLLKSIDEEPSIEKQIAHQEKPQSKVVTNSNKKKKKKLV